MSLIKRNLKLLIQDLKAPFVNTKITKEKEALLWEQNNRKEVLYLYRHFIKVIPKMQRNLFEETFAYEVLSLYKPYRK